MEVNPFAVCDVVRKIGGDLSMNISSIDPYTGDVDCWWVTDGVGDSATYRAEELELAK